MTEFKSFSIIVNLHHFLNDHRSISRIFINKRLKSIGDLQTHIANIYNIGNFYFICNNQYLPCSEDIRVLQPEDTVIVFPDKPVDENQIITNTSCAKQRGNKSQDKDIDSPEVLPLAVKTKKSHKRKHVSSKLNDICSVEVPQATKKRKKKSQKVAEEVTSGDSGKNETSLSDLKSSVKDKVSYFEEHSKSCENLEDKSTNKLSCDMRLQCKEAVEVVGHNNFKQNRGVLVKRRNDVISFELPKMTNVVKNVIVTPQIQKQLEVNVKERSQHVLNSPITRNNKEESHKNTPKVRSNNTGIENQILEEVKPSASEDKAVTESSFQDAISEVPPKKISRYSVEIIHDQSVVNVPEPLELNHLASGTTPRVPAIKASSEVEVLLDRSSAVTKSSSISMESAPSFINLVDTSFDAQRNSDFVTKRKRRRTHRKRKSSVETLSMSMAPVTSTPYMYQPPKIQTVPAIHIMFDEECESVPAASCTNGGEQFAEEIEDKHEAPTAPDEGDYVSQVVDLTSDAQNDVVDETSKRSEHRISENFILNAPVMDKISPKIGDLIAFKILRISEDYTPELSSFIVAKVLGFHEATKEITVYIVDGTDQLMEPQGKFAIPVENDSANSNVKNFLWSDFIEPRLLFP